MNYLQLTNRVLIYMNEPELTQAGFSSDRSIQTVAKNAVNDAIHDIINAEMEWPFLKTETTTTLYPGTYKYAVPASYRNIDFESFLVRHPELLSNTEFTSNITSWSDVSSGGGTAAYNSAGNGVARLTGDGTDSGAIEQSITTVIGVKYKLTFSFNNADVTVRIGTSSGDTTHLNTEISISTDDKYTLYETEFTATTTTTYIGFYNSSTTAADIDWARCRKSGNSRLLCRINYDDFRANYLAEHDYGSKTNMGMPLYVFYRNDDDYFGVSPVPNEQFELDWEYYTLVTDLSAYDDTPIIPARYHHVIVARARYYALSTRSDPVFADRANKEYMEAIKRMRTELINTNVNMRAP